MLVIEKSIIILTVYFSEVLLHTKISWPTKVPRRLRITVIGGLPTKSPRQRGSALSRE